MAAPLRVAVAGAGYFARYHYEAWTRIEDATLVALAEPDGARAGAVARDFAVPRTFESLEALLAEVEIDLLDIATPPETHHTGASSPRPGFCPVPSSKRRFPSSAYSQVSCDMHP